MMKLHNLKRMLCEELERYEDRERISLSDLETIHKLTDTIKNLEKIEMLEDGGYSRDNGYAHERGYSNDGRWQAEGMYSRNGGGYSGRHYVRGHYSRDDGKQRMIEELEKMMNNSNGQEHEAYQKAVEALKRG